MWMAMNIPFLVCILSYYYIKPSPIALLGTQGPRRSPVGDLEHTYGQRLRSAKQHSVNIIKRYYHSENR
jgi:hypothetical protein